MGGAFHSRPQMFVHVVVLKHTQVFPFIRSYVYIVQCILGVKWPECEFFKIFVLILFFTSCCVVTSRYRGLRHNNEVN
jgi:hypothetical protein